MLKKKSQKKRKEKGRKKRKIAKVQCERDQYDQQKALGFIVGLFKRWRKTYSVASELGFCSIHLLLMIKRG